MSWSLVPGTTSIPLTIPAVFVKTRYKMFCVLPWRLVGDSTSYFRSCWSIVADVVTYVVTSGHDSVRNVLLDVVSTPSRWRSIVSFINIVFLWN